MMDALPSAMLWEIMQRCEPKSRLALACTCKENYSMLFEQEPRFRDRYGDGWRFWKGLCEMLDFVKRDPHEMCYWAFHDRGRLVFRMSHRACMRMPASDLARVFARDILPVWGKGGLSMATGCWFKSKGMRARFMEIGHNMHDLIGG